MRVLLSACFAVIVLAGCGGGGLGTQTSSGSFGLFVTDNFRQDYDHVWATVFRLTLVDQIGASRTVFDDSNGRIIDIRTLHDAAGSRFAALGSFKSADVTYTIAKLAIGPTMALVPAGGTNAQIASLSPPVSGDGKIVVNVPLLNPRRLARGGDNLVIDFDLANFQIVAGKIVPVMKEGDNSTLGDAARHEREFYTGTLSNVSTNNGVASLTLTSPDGSILNAFTHAATSIWHVLQNGTPALLNGRVVKVLGLMSGNKLRADDIRIENNVADPNPHVLGVPSNGDTLAGTFTVTIRNAEGFVPKATTVNVVINNQTLLRSENGGFPIRGTFFNLLAGAAFVAVQGAYDSATNTLTATRAKIIGTGSDAVPPPQTEAIGIAVSANANVKTFTIQPVQQWQGFILQGNAVDVAPIASAQYKDIDGSALTAATFFNRIAGNAQRKVQVQGAFKTGGRGTIQADDLQILQ
jgi:hypothetical protein